VAEVHDRNAVRYMLNNQEVVSNKEIRELQLLLELFESIEDLGLNGDVERRNRFIANNEFRIKRKGSCDTNALALATREFVRITGGLFRRKTNGGHEFEHPFMAIILEREALFLAFFKKEFLVGINRLGDDVFDGHTGIQRRIGILENHLSVEMEILQVLLIVMVALFFLS